MLDEKNTHLNNFKRDIYFEYLELKNLNKVFNLVSVDSEDYNFLIPNSYNIDYSLSNNIYDTNGHIYFYNDKYNYCIDYTKKDYESYKIHMKKKEKYIVNKFENYRNQEFIEISKNDNDIIYMYYNEYYFKIYSDHKFTMNEYFDIYFILFSVCSHKINKSIELLKELCFFIDNAIKFKCDNVDILKYNLKDYTEHIELGINDILVYSNDNFLKYKGNKNLIDDISIKILNNNVESLSIDYDCNKWNLNGFFNFGTLGNFNKGYIDGYNEITDSDELSFDDKKSILSKIILEKQYSVEGYKSSIKKEFYSYLRDYINRELSYELWNNYHIREFVDFDVLLNDDKQTNDFNLYKIFMSNIYSSVKLFDDKLVMDSLKGEEIIINPNGYILRLSGLNGLLNRIKIKFDEEFNLIFK